MIYVLKMSSPLGDPTNPRGQASYYLGFCAKGRLDERVAEHRGGRGARITAAAVARGIGLEVVAAVDGDRALERKLKRSYKNTPRFVARLTRGSQRVVVQPRRGSQKKKGRAA